MVSNTQQAEIIFENTNLYLSGPTKLGAEGTSLCPYRKENRNKHRQSMTHVLKIKEYVEYIQNSAFDIVLDCSVSR